MRKVLFFIFISRLALSWCGEKVKIERPNEINNKVVVTFLNVKVGDMKKVLVTAKAKVEKVISGTLKVGDLISVEIVNSFHDRYFGKEDIDRFIKSGNKQVIRYYKPIKDNKLSSHFQPDCDGALLYNYQPNKK